ncbi:protease pro-enzyme activation domain-containing protein [Apilactobacillus kunkeei]|nr:protease pro-enzyme activation domain-containing protein [Apilactobacillus kunkeei]
MNYRKTIIATLSASVLLGTAFNFNVDSQAKKTLHKVKIHKKAKDSSATSNFAIVLKTRNNSKLENYVLTKHKKFLSTKQFANRYGQTNKTVSAIQKYFKKYHIKTTKYAGNLVLRGYGSKTNIQKALKYKQVRVKVNGKFVYRPIMNQR